MYVYYQDCPNESVLPIVTHFPKKVYYRLWHISKWKCITDCDTFHNESVLPIVTHFAIKVYYRLWHISQWKCITDCDTFPNESVLPIVTRHFTMKMYYRLWHISQWKTFIFKRNMRKIISNLSNLIFEYVLGFILNIWILTQKFIA